MLAKDQQSKMPKSLYFIRTMQIWNIEHGVTEYSDVLESLRFDLTKSRGLHSSVVPGTFIRGCVKSICQIPPGIQCRECGGCRNVSKATSTVLGNGPGCERLQFTECPGQEREMRRLAHRDELNRRGNETNRGRKTEAAACFL